MFSLISPQHSHNAATEPKASALNTDDMRHDGAEGDPVLGLRLVTGMAAFWQGRGWFGQVPGWLTEGRTLLENALSKAPNAPPALLAGTLGAFSGIALEQKDLPHTKLLADERLTLYRRLDDKAGIADTLINLALEAHDAGDRLADG
jgi:hypothetical protein